MPATPPYPVNPSPGRTPPDPLPPPVMIREPIMGITFPFGCSDDTAVLTIDCTPFFDREPDTIPDDPGGGDMYSKFVEYLDVGWYPTDGYWSGRGVTSWSIYIDGVLYTGGSIPIWDSEEGPFSFPISALLIGAADWTAPHTYQLRGVYNDRPGFAEDTFDTVNGGIGQWGPSTSSLDPKVYYTLDGNQFGCCERHPSFFPSVLWGNVGVYNNTLSAHRAVLEDTGPRDRHGNILGFAGPWTSTNCPKQFLSAGPGKVPPPCSDCTVCGNISWQPNGTAGCGDVYASSLTSIFDTHSVPAVNINYQTAPQTLGPCVSVVTGVPVFDATRSFKAVPA